MELIGLSLLAALAIASWQALAKRRGYSKRRRYNLRRVSTTAEVALATLAATTVITAGLTGTSGNAYRCMSVKAAWSIIGKTLGEGPILVGYSHSDYSVTEVKECLEAQTSININDKVTQEQANRLVRIVGTFGGRTDERLNDGKPITTRLNWAVGIGREIDIFAYNDFGSALTTGSVVNINGALFVKDSV